MDEKKRFDIFRAHAVIIGVSKQGKYTKRTQ